MRAGVPAASDAPQRATPRRAQQQHGSSGRLLTYVIRSCPSFCLWWQNEAIFDQLNLTGDLKNKVVDQIKKRLTPQPVKIRSGTQAALPPPLARARALSLSLSLSLSL